MMGNGNPQNPNVDPVTQASVASLLNKINYYITKVSGTAAITGFRLPRGFRGSFIVIPTAAFTGATGGTLAYAGDLAASPPVALTEDIPIGLAFTAVVDRPLFFTTNGLLVYPSYV